MTYRVLLVGGGSGGHVYPLVAVARALTEQAQKQGKALELLLIGDGEYAQRAAREAGIRYKSIVAPKLRRYTSVRNFLDLFKVPLALIQSLWQLLLYMPDVVFAKGGYTCVFPTLAARFYRIPSYLHESDSVPGLANRILAKRSRLIFTAFSSADQAFAQMGRPTRQVGNPFRMSLGGQDRATALTALELASDKKTIFVTGSSQGAEPINRVIMDGLVQLVQKGYNLIHQTGQKNFQAVKTAVEQYMSEGKDSYAPLIGAQYRVYPFLDEAAMATAYAASDVVVARASANTFTEVSYLGKPCIVIPLAGSAGDHQVYNAAEFGHFGAVVVDGANISPQILIQQIEHILEPTVYADLAQRIRAFAKPDAAAQIASVLLG